MITCNIYFGWEIRKLVLFTLMSDPGKLTLKQARLVISCNAYIHRWILSFELYQALGLLYKARRAICIKGLIWPPLEPKTASCFSPISSDWFIERITSSVKFWHLFNFYRYYASKKGLQNRLKNENCLFGPNLRLWETDFCKNRYQYN